MCLYEMRVYWQKKRLSRFQYSAGKKYNDFILSLMAFSYSNMCYGDYKKQENRFHIVFWTQATQQQTLKRGLQTSLMRKVNNSAALCNSTASCGTHNTPAMVPTHLENYLTNNTEMNLFLQCKFLLSTQDVWKILICGPSLYKKKK